MPRLYRVALIGWFLLALSPAAALADMEQEIAHLLRFVEESPCVFVRNGKEHEPSKAREHIEKKYDHYRDKIKTTEDFIAYSATKSLLSGQRYQVLCDGVEQTAGEWLLNELHAYRARMAGATP